MHYSGRELQDKLVEDIDCCVQNDEDIDKNVDRYLDLLIRARGELPIYMDPQHKGIEGKSHKGLDPKAYPKKRLEAFGGAK